MRRQEVIANLKYIASSPGKEHGGFHRNAVRTAKAALKIIEAQAAPINTQSKPCRHAWEPILGKRVFHVGDKVTYQLVGKSEHGIVKSLSDADHVFVVYHCAEKWDQYLKYTAARTAISDLVSGWWVEDTPAE